MIQQSVSSFISNLHSKPDIVRICRFVEMLGQSWPNDMGDNCGVPESWQTTMTGVSGVLMFWSFWSFDVLKCSTQLVGV